MKKTLFFFTILSTTLGYAQTTINSFLGDWNQSDGKLLKITALSNNEGNTKARYDYGTYYYNSNFPNPSQYNYVVVYNPANNTITFTYISQYVDYIQYTTYYQYSYNVTNISQSQMTLTNSINGEVLTYTKGILGTSDLSKSSKQVILAENPVKDELILKLGDGVDQIPVKIYNLEGKLLKKIMYSEKKPTDVSDLAKGIYILEIQNKNQSSTIKMIKD
ncbi:T9SS type A sorting domain-containing protein [Chryseobacterium sp. PBS4-4]|uniref:T9SS type A sorting domain-containing protein n=1 Tax=Chryseobacterium edaphi TaxID=2976532 RepID=A0ABT2W5J0_9FLAO|nr:T9SS type A sorting domain-containing protein [Chryseobacterium edaphi]MCU7616654.1 T9SS type A sorting domain-containing protein [Chryseobacterium edaphi]